MSSQPKSKKQYFAAWDKWEQQALPGECRAEAVKRLKRWFEHHQPGFHEKLSLDRLNLTSLPPDLPASLTRLDISHNHLESLPSLPPFLKYLEVSDNHLKSLPANLPPALKSLIANNNQLTSLPTSLPLFLKNLSVNNNRLTSVSTCLPLMIKYLDVSDNLLTSLPDLPPLLKYLDASGSSIAPPTNQLTSLPRLPPLLETLIVNDNQLLSLPILPASLKRIMVARNLLTSLPRLPARLKELNVAFNRLTSLPEHFETLNFSSEVIVTGNPLSEETRDRFEIVRSPMGFERLLGVRQNSANEKSELWQAVQAWYGTDNPNRAAAWNKIHQEAHENSTAFFQEFLYLLQKTAEMGGATCVAFTVRVLTLLDAMEKDKELREICFGFAYEAVSDCHDKVTLEFNRMELAHLSLRAARGEFTQQELFKLGMDFFKLQMLEQLAKKKARKVGKKREELEVALYYQMKLGDTLLELSPYPQDMRYAGEATTKKKWTWIFGSTKRVPVVMDEDLYKAAQAVQAAAGNPQEITKFLTGWKPWQKDLARLYPEKFSPAALQAAKEQMQEELADLYDEEKNPDLNEGQRKEMADALQAKYNALDDTLFGDEWKRLTEEFVKANTASSSRSTA